MKQVKWNFKNFAVQNTPAFIQKIGNIGLIAAGMGTLILAIPDTFIQQGFEFVLPHFLVVISKGLIGIGILAKLVTKFAGEIETTINGPK